VVVIGGGFAGLSSARYLREADPCLDVALIERDHIGSGASGRSAGVLSPFLPMLWLMGCSENSQRSDDIRFAVRYIARETQSLLALISNHRIACDLNSGAIITTGVNGLYRHYLRLVAERCLLAGIPGHMATPEELRSALPYAAHGGFVLEGHVLQPLALAQGLRRRICQLGVRLYENTSVTHLRPMRGGIEVCTETGACLRAARVVVATNGFPPWLGLGPFQGIPKPTTTYLLATAPLGQALRTKLGVETRTIGDIGRNYYYWRLYENRLLFGGCDRPGGDGAERGRDEPYYRRLRAEMLRRFPFLRDVPVDAMWCGSYHETRIGVPIIRALKHIPEVILNVGYGGVGVTLTQFSGKMITGLVLGERHRDPDSDRMLRIYAATRFPVKEGIKLGWRLLRSLAGGTASG
jgi:gamma-glutamylputrescine oxidase